MNSLQELGWNLFEFGFERLFLVFRRPFAFVGNDARGGRRNTGLARRSPRFCSFVQNLLSFPLHLITIPQPIPDSKNSKAERRLQIDASIRGGLGKGLAGEPIGKTEK
jgi:hypothetical protein